MTDSSPSENAETKPISVEELRHRAGKLVAQDKISEAIELLKLIVRREQDLSALKQLAGLYFTTQDFEGAAGCLDKILTLDPGNGHVWNSRAMCFSALGRDQEATGCFERAAVYGPKVAAFHQNLAHAYEKSNRWSDAANSYRNALALEPLSQSSLHGLAAMCSNLGNYVEQLEVLEKLVGIRALTSEEQLFQVESLIRLERTDEAAQCLESVLAQDPGNALAHYLRGALSQELGNHAEASKNFLRAIELDPKLPPAYWYLAQSKKFTQEDAPIVGRMEELAAAPTTSQLGKGVLNFSLGSAYNDLGDYGCAMSHYDEANRIFKFLATDSFSLSSLKSYTDDLIATFTKEFLSSYPQIATDSKLPLFIVGMPRSGTTLTETILSNHPSVAPGGEISFWPTEAPKAILADRRGINQPLAQSAAHRYLALLRHNCETADRVTDKLPFNYKHIGLLHMLFPKAHFVHCRRNPVDNCLSFFMTTFNHPPSFSFDKENIVAAYREYARLMAHWRKVIPEDRLIEIDYEDLVTNQEAASRRMVEFCGLEWADECLHPERNDRLISTMSHWQARQPVYQSSVERWRRYQPWLGAFQSLLDDPPQF